MIYYSTRDFLPKNEAIKEHNSRRNHWYLGTYVKEIVELDEEFYQEITSHESINTEILNKYER